MKWGLGRSASFHTSMQHIDIQYIIVARPKLTNVKRVENYSHTRKTKDYKTERYTFYIFRTWKNKKCFVTLKDN